MEAAPVSTPAAAPLPASARPHEETVASGPPQWPTFAATASVSADDKAKVATALIDFIESGFAATKWADGFLALSLQSGPFSTTYRLGAEQYWQKWFTNTARQANWLQHLAEQASSRGSTGKTEWADVESAVLSVVRERGYFGQLRRQGEVQWSPPPVGRKATGKVEPSFVFGTTEFASGKEKAQFATKFDPVRGSGIRRQEVHQGDA